MTDQLVKDNERVDDLQNGYYVIQDPDKFCFGMDAVLLSGFAKVKKGEIALDKSVQIWPDAVSCIITWRTMLISCREILKRLLRFLGRPLLM